MCLLIVIQVCEDLGDRDLLVRTWTLRIDHWPSFEFGRKGLRIDGDMRTAPNRRIGPDEEKGKTEEERQRRSQQEAFGGVRGAAFQLQQV